MAFLGFDNHVLTGTLAGGGSYISNLTSRIGADLWQTGVNVAGGAYFTIDTGSTSSKWRAVGAFQTNFTSSCEMVVKLGTTLNGSDVYSGTAKSGAVAGRNYLIDLLSQEYTARYLRVEFTDTSNPDAELRIGLAYGGPLVAPGIGMTFGSAMGLVTDTTEFKTLGGQEYPTFNSVQYGWDLKFDAITDAEVLPVCDALTQYAATGENVLFIPYSDGTRLLSQSVYGRPKIGARVTASNFNMNQWTFPITDRL